MSPFLLQVSRALGLIAKGGVNLCVVDLERQGAWTANSARTYSALISVKPGTIREHRSFRWEGDNKAYRFHLIFNRVETRTRKVGNLPPNLSAVLLAGSKVPLGSRLLHSLEQEAGTSANSVSPKSALRG